MIFQWFATVVCPKMSLQVSFKNRQKINSSDISCQAVPTLDRNKQKLFL